MIMKKIYKELVLIRKELQTIRCHLESNSEKNISETLDAINEATQKTGNNPLIV